MRGPLRWAQNCGAQNRGEAPSSSSLRSSTSPRSRGEVNRISFSRRMRARVLPTPLPKSSFGARSRHAATGGGTGLRLDHAPISQEKKKGSGTPTDAHCMKPHQRMRPRAKRRALACRRSTTALAAATERHRSAPVHALPGTELVRDGRYPSPAVPVQRAILARRPVIVPAGRFGPEPPGSGADNPARGNRLAPLRRCHPAASLRAR